MSFRTAAQALKKSWWIVVCTVAVALAGGVGLILLSTQTYASSVTFFVRTPADQLGGAYQGDQFAQKRVNSYIELAESRRLADLVKNNTQLDLTTDQITSMITAKGDMNTVLLSVTVTDTDAQRSLDIARSISTQFITLVADLETPPGSETPTVSLEVTSAPTLNPAPVEPRKGLIMSLAAVFGLLVGIAIAILRELLDQTVRSSEAISELTEAPALATIPFDQSAKLSPLVVNSDARSIRAEAFRQLRTNLQFIDVDNPARVIVVTSSLPGEGKSSTATNLAVMFAEADKKALLIEADLRRPKVAEYLGLEGAVGLTNVLAGQVEISEVLQPWGRGGLTLLPSGTLPPNPSEILGSENMNDLLDSLKKAFDIIIIDTPPLLPVTDAAVAAVKADGAILVARYGKTTNQQLTRAKQSLDAVGARTLGSVLNMTPVSEKAYGYGYASYEQVESAPSGPNSHTRAETAGVDRIKTGATADAAN